MVSEKKSQFEVREFYTKTKDILKLRLGSGKIGFSKKTAQSSLQKDHSPVQVWSARDIKDMQNLSKVCNWSTTKLQSLFSGEALVI